MALAAGPLLIASQTRNPTLVALATIMQRAPWFLFGLYASWIADRFDRRLMVAIADAFRGVVTGWPSCGYRDRRGQCAARFLLRCSCWALRRPLPTLPQARCCLCWLHQETSVSPTPASPLADERSMSWLVLRLVPRCSSVDWRCHSWCKR